MKLKKLPVHRDRYQEMLTPGLAEANDSPHVYFDIAAIMVSPYLARFFAYEDLPDVVAGAQAILPVTWGMVGDMSIIGNFGDPITIAACGRFARLVAYDDLAEAIEETQAVLDQTDPAHVRQYFTYERPPPDVDASLSYHLVGKYHDLIDRGDYFDELYRRGSILLHESDVYEPIDSKEALDREIADLIDNLPDYETRRWVPTIAGPNPFIFDVVVAAGERYFGAETIKLRETVIRKAANLSGLEVYRTASSFFLIETTTGQRFGAVRDGRIRLIDAGSGEVLAEADYPS